MLKIPEQQLASVSLQHSGGPTFAVRIGEQQMLSAFTSLSAAPMERRSTTCCNAKLYAENLLPQPHRCQLLSRGSCFILAKLMGIYTTQCFYQGDVSVARESPTLYLLSFTSGIASKDEKALASPTAILLVCRLLLNTYCVIC